MLEQRRGEGERLHGRQRLEAAQGQGQGQAGLSMQQEYRRGQQPASKVQHPQTFLRVGGWVRQCVCDRHHITGALIKPGFAVRALLLSGVLLLWRAFFFNVKVKVFAHGDAPVICSVPAPTPKP